MFGKNKTFWEKFKLNSSMKYPISVYKNSQSSCNFVQTVFIGYEEHNIIQ